MVHGQTVIYVRHAILVAEPAQVLDQINVLLVQNLLISRMEVVVIVVPLILVYIQTQ